MAFRRGWGGELSIPCPKGVPFSGFRHIYERVGLLLTEVHLSFLVCKKAQKVLQVHFKRSGLVVYSYFENGAFTAVKTWMQSSK